MRNVAFPGTLSYFWKEIVFIFRASNETNVIDSSEFEDYRKCSRSMIFMRQDTLLR